MNRKLLTVTGLIAAALLFLAVNILANAGLRHVRLDLTEGRLFTLSDGSKNIMRSIKEPILLRLFFSERLSNEVPALKLYANRVRELLEDYVALSNGKLRLEVIDPEPFSDAEDRAVQAGVQAVPLDQTGRTFYFGLVGTNSTDDQEVIPLLQQDREVFLEYDLTKLVYGLTSPKKPAIGLISGLPLDYGPGGMMAAMRGQAQPYAIMQQLRQFFEVKTLEINTTSIDDQIGILILAHPKDLSTGTQYAIDQFVLRGGRLVVFADPYSETAAAIPDPATGRPAGGDQSSLLPDLFKSWGVTVEPGMFVGDLGLAQRVQTGRPGARNVVDYVAWIAAAKANIARDDVVTSDLNALNLGSAGSIRKADGGTTTVTPLLQSSNQAMLLPIEKVSGTPDPDGLLQGFKPTGERYVLAARITGPIKTAFPDGPPAADKPADADAKGGAKPLTESVKPVNIILIADADALDDRFWVRIQDVFGQKVTVPLANNADLLVNAVDNLGGSNDLIALRGRSSSSHPFEVIETLRRNAEQQYLERQKALQKKLEDTEKQLAEMQGKGQAGTLVPADQQAAIEGFRQELVSTRQELRGVQLDLNRDIGRLQAWVKFVNIALIPILVSILALVLAAWQRRRNRARAALH